MFGIEFNIETLIMLPIAMVIDVFGLVLLCCGLDDCGVLDIIWMTVYTPWLLFRGKQAPKKNGLWGWFQGLFTNKYGRFLTPGIGGLVPYFGNMFFFKTLSVLFNVQK